MFFLFTVSYIFTLKINSYLYIVLENTYIKLKNIIVNLQDNSQRFYQYHYVISFPVLTSYLKNSIIIFKILISVGIFSKIFLLFFLRPYDLYKRFIGLDQ